jgi:hypothetical protein
MLLILKFFSEGKIYPLNVDGSLESSLKYLKDSKEKGNSSVVTYTINNRELCKKIIIPFFDKYPLFTTKSFDFAD